MSAADGIAAVRRVLEGHAEVRLVYLFESVARGEDRRSSDLDVGVVFSPVPEPAQLDQLATDLEAAAGRRVDLVVLNRAAPLLIHEAIRPRHVVVCRDDDERVDFETRATARYLDTAHLRRVQHHYLRERSEARRARPA
ncbi:MAG TPA: nucleotidyltransferase domain-containing protein [Candidatus Acidoferrum sp.]|nr:nucleotidyltransferase domain-containing protein [Candidatus Acidoferrum sp.]